MNRRSPLVVLGLVTMILALAAPSEAQSSQVRVRRDIRYGTAGEVDLLLDVYLPSGEGPHPGVIVIPGGKWVTGDKSNNPEVSQYFAEQGFVAFAVSYRSATDAPYPAAIDDVRQAVAWIRGHASEFEVDTGKLVALGWSAGGHLAGLLGTLGQGPLDRGTRVRAVVSWSGPMNLVPLVKSSNEVLKDVIETFLGCTGAQACEEAARRASPIVYVDSTDASIYFANSTAEVIPVGQARQMASALTSAGLSFRYRELPGRHHGAGYAANPKMMDEAIGFIREAFGETPAQEEEQAAGSSPTKAPPKVEASPETAPLKPAASESSPRSLPRWAFLLAIFGLAALVISTIQLGVALRALRLARRTMRGQAGGDSGHLTPTGYAPRSTEDTHSGS
ncbi:MAG TPA: alpha/beta hydrolase [Actinomycetota bacterium]|jgi:acetyl esterase/lipase|nr:alpha/beta hydrolase [Actinomycetota bacterium]